MKNKGFSQLITLFVAAALVLAGVVYYVMSQTEGTIYIPRLMQLNSPTSPDLGNVEKDAQDLDLGDLDSEFKDIDQDIKSL